MRILPAILIISIVLCISTTALAADPPQSGKLVKLQLETTLVPSPAAVDVLLPPGYDRLTEPVPLFIWLHMPQTGRMKCSGT